MALSAFMVGSARQKAKITGPPPAQSFCYMDRRTRYPAWTGLAAVLNQLQEANIPHGAEIFGGARHSFTIEGSLDYDQAAEQGSWNAFMRFLTGNTGS